MPNFGLKRRTTRRRRQAAEEEEKRSRSDDDTSEREESKETIRSIVNPHSDVITSGQSAIERIVGKGFRRITRRNGSRKMPRRGKRTATRRRRH